MRMRLLYDGSCAFCRAQMRWLKRLDWFGIIDFIPITEAGPLKLPPEYTREALLQAIHGVTGRGEIFSGAKAFRWVGLRVPLLVPIALLMWIPGVIGPAECIYRWIARNRHRLVKSGE